MLYEVITGAAENKRRTAFGQHADFVIHIIEHRITGYDAVITGQGNIHEQGKHLACTDMDKHLIHGQDVQNGLVNDIAVPVKFVTVHSIGEPKVAQIPFRTFKQEKF